MKESKRGAFEFRTNCLLYEAFELKIKAKGSANCSEVWVVLILLRLPSTFEVFCLCLLSMYLNRISYLFSFLFFNFFLIC